jgi:hypothetical protein
MMFEFHGTSAVHVMPSKMNLPRGKTGAKKTTWATVLVLARLLVCVPDMDHVKVAGL